MTSTSQTEIDQLILSSAKADWRKTAFIMARVLHDCEDKNSEVRDEEVVDRIAAQRAIPSLAGRSSFTPKRNEAVHGTRSVRCG
jgi:hypothetical protein